MQIKNIYVSNFKSFKELNFNFSKINIVLGPNNSGKSNIFKLLLLLKQTLTSSLISPLILNGSILNLGSYKDISYKFNSKTICIKFIISDLQKYAYIVEEGEEYFESDDEFSDSDFEISYEFEIDFDLNRIEFTSYNIKNLKTNERILEFEKNKCLNLNSISIEDYNIRCKKIFELIIRELEYFKKYQFKTEKNLFKRISKIAKTLKIKLEYPYIDSLIDYFIQSLSEFKQDAIEVSLKSNIPEIIINLDFYDDPIYYLKEFSKHLSSKDVYLNLDKFLLIEQNSSVKHHISSLKNFLNELNELEKKYDNISNFFQNFNNSITSFFYELYYIGPLRSFPQRYYPVLGEVARDVGFKGEFLPQILKETREKEKQDKLFNKINKWLKKFEMASHTDIKKYDEIKEFISIMFNEYFSGVRVNITDMGMGTSQVLPVIIEGFIIDENSTFLVEQPEIHLHPKAQAVLGDLFIEIANENKTLIIETHSEHLIQRIQRRVAEGIISSNDIAFYFVTMGEEGSILKKLSLDEDGYIINIPDGFFAEDFNETYEHLKAVIKKKKI